MPLQGTIIPVAEWLPDLTNDGTGATDEDIVQNVIPDVDSYRPWPELEVLTSSLDARAQGAHGAIDSSRNAFDFAGDATKLYRVQSVTAWANWSRTTSSTYTISIDQWWEFVQWGNTVLATNGLNEVQEHSLGTTNRFANLPGAPPVGYHLAIVRDFVWLGNIAGFPQRVRWSAINNSQSWTVDANTQADFQDLPGDGGQVQKVVGGNVATIFQERAIWRAHYVGSPQIFDFGNGPIERALGVLAPQTVAWYGDLIFFLSEGGFCLLSPAGLKRIGLNKIDRTFFADLDAQYIYRVQAVIDPVDKLYIVAAPGAGNTLGRPNRLWVYNFAIDRWSRVNQDTEMVWRYISVGYDLDSLDPFGTLDDLPESLDSSLWVGGQINLAAFDSSHRTALFTGDAKAAQVNTREVEIAAGRRMRMTRVKILADGLSGATMTPITRNDMGSARIVGSAVSAMASGDYPLRANARYFSFRIASPAATSFTRVKGVQLLDGSVEGDR